MTGSDQSARQLCSYEEASEGGGEGSIKPFFGLWAKAKMYGNKSNFAS